MTRFAAPISEQIWDMKYRLKKADGTILDHTVEGTWGRIANALAAREDNSEYWAQKFYSALEDFKFLPAGRIISGAGTGRSVTMFNCFVMGTIPDSMSGIFDMLKEAALTMQQGGGIGYDFSTIRPSGFLVKGVDADASGPLTFMDCWDAMCRTVMSAGSRRGAMMATMRCDHPDIMKFIDAKKDAAKLRMFNLSVLITDDFMAAVKADHAWNLVFNGEVHDTVYARDLWNQIMQATYDYAEPGVIFIDRINELNNLNYCETISATNPCGEQPLPPYGACLLGSINLAALVQNPFQDNAGISLTQLDSLVRTAVRMLDNVIDVSNFPLEKQAQEAQDKRRIGLGVTGVADALAMIGITYGSADAVDWLHTIMAQISDSSYDASADLAIEKGPFPLFEYKAFFDGTFADNKILGSTRSKIIDSGIRNALLTSIAPTGTISLYAGNVSSGIEPIFATEYERKVLQKDGSKTVEKVRDYAVHIYRQMFGEDAELPAQFVTAQTLTPMDHIRMQSGAQTWVDSSISKTINCPEDIGFEDFKEIYLEAYNRGCKGCTTYRPNAVTGSVLSVDEKPQEAQTQTPAPQVSQNQDTILERPESLSGATYKLKWADSPHAFYITISDIVTEDGVTRPFEIFINSKSMEHYQWIVGLTRMISAVFRRGGDVSFVAEELKAVFDPRGGAWQNGKYVPSLLAAIGGVIEQHLSDTFDRDVEITDAELASLAEWERTSGPPPQTCKSCGGFNVTKESGCSVCKDCGHSACS